MTCDRCHITEDDVLEMQEWLKLDILGDYASLLGDGERWELDLCQKCFHELLGQYMRTYCQLYSRYKYSVLIE